MARADGIDLRARHRMVLDDVDVLERRGMENEIGLQLVEDLEDLLAVHHVAENLGGLERRMRDGHFAKDRVERELRVVEENELRRLHGGDLPAQLRADRAAR